MGKEIPYGYCHCGCGNKVKIATSNKKGNGSIIIKKGEPYRYLPYHHFKAMRKENHPNWKGGVTHNADGYVVILTEDDKEKSCSRYRHEHVIISEKVLGHKLPLKAEVHHVNGLKHDNNNGNLVICQDRAYHILLHQRTRAYNATGDANKKWCTLCQSFDDVSNMISFDRKNGRSAVYYHRGCWNQRCRESAQKRKERTL